MTLHRIQCVIFIFFCTLSCTVVAQLTDSNLPIFVITTDSGTIQDEPKTRAHLGVIYDSDADRNNLADGYNHYDGIIGIELRGATSQSLFEKKGYAVETRKDDGSNNNVELLGLPKENDWVLHGPYSDKTLMRNALTYCLAGELMEYAPRIKFIELIIDDMYKGVYLLTEKIKVDKNRVDITKQEGNTNDITGGYILKLDKSEGAASVGFESKYPAYPNDWQKSFYQFHFPKTEDVTPEQFEYIENLIGEIEDEFVSDDFADVTSGYSNYLDENTFIDYLIINELSKNPDAYRLSTFFYKDTDEIDPRFKMGPVWDYNLAFGNVNYCTNGNPEGFVVSRFNEVCPDDFWVINFWWDRLLDDTLFTNKLEDRWAELRLSTLSEFSIHSKIDSFANILNESQQRNFSLYPILDVHIWPNYSVEGSYAREVQRLKDWVSTRLIWIDQNLATFSVPPFNRNFEFDPVIMPNPVNENAIIKYYSHQAATVEFNIFDATGRVLYHEEPLDKISGFNEIRLPLHLDPGIYYYRLVIDENSFGGSFIR